MRLTNFVLDTLKATVSSGSHRFTADSTDPDSRYIQNNVYPWGGDVKTPNRVFQGATRIADANDSVHVNVMVEGAAIGSNLINNNSTMKMTGSLSAIPEPGSEYTWDILMVADSEFKG